MIGFAPYRAQHHLHRQHLIVNAANQRDPTRTTALRNSFAREMTRRFRRLTREITKAIVEEDVFGLMGSADTAMVRTLQTPGPRQFAFPRDSRKVAAFTDWLRRQSEAGILDVREFSQIGEGVERAWTNKYIYDSYSRGVQRARYQLRQAGFDVPPLSETGGLGVSLATPFHADRVGLLFTRTFNELRGITAAMDQQISRVLAQGLADGLHPRQLARDLVKTIGGPALDLTDRLGRFIPAARRAQILARTEIIRAHAEAQLQEFSNWGVAGVAVQAEVVTAQDDRVCPICLPQHGVRYPIEVAHNLIPFHPQCRCAWSPWSAALEEKLRRIREGGSGGWVNKTSVEETTKQLKQKAGIEMHPQWLKTNQMIARANAVGKTMTDDVFAKLPNIGKLDAGYYSKKVTDPVITRMTSDLYSVSSQATHSTLAFYRPDFDDITLGVKQLSKLTGSLKTGNTWVIGTDLSSTVRHEYAHHLYQFMRRVTSTSTEGISKGPWNGFFNSYWTPDPRNPGRYFPAVEKGKGLRGSEIFSKTVSKYAATDANEAFAESFSAYTHPEYAPGVPGKSLPKHIEELLESIIGKRTDL